MKVENVCIFRGATYQRKNSVIATSGGDSEFQQGNSLFALLLIMLEHFMQKMVRGMIETFECFKTLLE